MTASPVTRLAHGEVRLALHALRDRPAMPALLLIHQLGGGAADWTGPALHPALERWPGAVHALDLAGHGESDWRRGGAYTPELFAADVDLALAVLGPCRLLGAGLGAWAALLVAGARPALVPAVLLLPGAGLAGGGAVPGGARGPGLVRDLDALEAGRDARTTPADPLVHSCACDVRPPDYAAAFAARAERVLLLEDGGERPPWWTALRAAAVAVPDLAGGLRALADGPIAT